jgi:hypothetical protein
MKKFIIALAALFTTAAGFAKGNDNGMVDRKVLEAFRKDFTAANNVSWETGKDYLQATFTINGQTLFAFYSEEGEQVGVAKNMLSTQLPAVLYNDLKNNYGDFWITELFEMTTASGTSYYMTLENAGKRIVVKSDGSTDWSLYKKERKD